MTTQRWGVAVAVAAAMVVATVADADAQRRRRRGRAAKVDVAAQAASLRGPDATAAIAAAGTLGGAPSEESQNALLDALAAGLAPPVAIAALEALAAQANPASFSASAQYARHRNPAVRAAAVAALGRLDDRRAEAAVLLALRDFDQGVRTAAATAVATRKIRGGIEPLLALLEKGDDPAAEAVAALADPSLAVALAELIGVAPDALLARALGAILLRSDFGPDTARLEVVRALAKVPGSEALEQLSNYVSQTPENPPRSSRAEAEALMEQRLESGL